MVKSYEVKVLKLFFSANFGFGFEQKSFRLSEGFFEFRINKNNVY